MVNRIFVIFAALFACSPLATLRADKPASEADYYRIVDLQTGIAPSNSRDLNWKPGDDIALEISGMDRLPDGRLAVALRKGDVYLIDGVYDEPAKLSFKRIATALHEPMGLLYHDGAFFAAQRTELTRMRDTDGDEVMDEYIAVAHNWQPAEDYHEYVYGPKLDGDGHMWITLNLGMGKTQNNSLPWHGWAMRLGSDGMLEPMCAGMRSPSGIGANAAGDMFYTDQQGTWVGTNTLHHLRAGAFFGNGEAMGTMKRDDAPIHLSAPLPANKPFPEAVKLLKELVPPAVWFPYHKMGESTTDILLDNTAGKFGPFAGQLFIGEFRSAGMLRVSLEKVNGEYQGACFPFRSGFASGVFRMCYGKDGSMFVGMTNRGWTSAGVAAYGLQRLIWTGKTPFEILSMHATPDGFDLTFTQPVDRTTAGDPASYAGSSYTYEYHAAYGSDEILTKPLVIRSATVAQDRMSVHLVIDGRRELYVHELHADGVRNKDGQPLLHPVGYYTLNAIPSR
ncbi:MAG: hypothetical protein GC162_18845 [Planctomycetes bacterium]|nr:hypothetical protein [Planctomycetota bacterium]